MSCFSFLTCVYFDDILNIEYVLMNFFRNEFPNQSLHTFEKQKIDRYYKFTSVDHGAKASDILICQNATEPKRE